VDPPIVIPPIGPKISNNWIPGTKFIEIFVGFILKEFSARPKKIFFPGWMDCPCLPPPALAVKCWTAGIYQQLNKLLKGARVKETL